MKSFANVSEVRDEYTKSYSVCLTWQGTILKGVLQITRESALTIAKESLQEVADGFEN